MTIAPSIVDFASRIIRELPWGTTYVVQLDGSVLVANAKGHVVVGPNQTLNTYQRNALITMGITRPCPQQCPITTCLYGSVILGHLPECGG
jgi:hypothetical protein